MKQHYVYMTTNLLNDMKYIGKHYGELDDSYLGSGTILRNAVKKYGANSFKKEVMCICESDEEACEKEKYYISLYGATINPKFYNLHVGGSGGNTTAGFTPEQREELRRKQSEATRGEKNGMYGKKRPQEYKEYMSFWASTLRDNSVYRTSEYRKRMGELKSGSNNGMYGKKHTPECRERMSKNRTGKTLGSKNGMCGKKGVNALNGKSLYAYYPNKTLAHTFNTRQLALEFLGLKGHTKLMECLDKDILYHGYYWKSH